MYTTFQKFVVAILYGFEKSNYTHQGFIYLIKSTVKTVILWHFITI